MIDRTTMMYIKGFFGSMIIFVLMFPLAWIGGVFVIINALVAPLLYVAFFGPKSDDLRIMEVDDQLDTIARDPTAKEGAGFSTLVFHRDGVKFSVARSDVLVEDHQSDVLKYDLGRSGNEDDIRTILVDRHTNIPFFVHIVREAKYNAMLVDPTERWPFELKKYAVGVVVESRPIFNKVDMMQMVAEIDPSKIAEIDFAEFKYFDSTYAEVEMVRFSHEAMAYA